MTPEERAAIADARKEEDGLKLRGLGLAEKSGPDEAAEALSLARKNGVPRVSVETDLQGYRSLDEMERVDNRTKDTPALRQWLAWHDDNYAVARDDVDNLSGVEKAMRTMGAFAKGAPRAALQGVLDMRTQAYGEPLRYVEPVGDYATRLQDWEARKDDRKVLTRNADGTLNLNLGNLIRGTAGAVGVYDNVKGGSYDRKPERPMAAALLGGQNLKNEAEYIKAWSDVLKPWQEQLAKGAADSAKAADELNPQTGDFVADSALSGVRSLSNMMLALVVAAKAGPSASAAVMGGQVQGQEYAFGRFQMGLDVQTAAERSDAQAAIELVTERISLGVLDDIIASNKPIVQKFIAGMTAEQIQEQAATFGQDFIDWQIVNPEKSTKDFLLERPERAAQTAIATFVAAGGMQGALMGLDYALTSADERARRSLLSEGDKAIEDAIKAAGKSKLAQRSPEKMEEAVRAIGEANGIDNVAVDLDGVVEALNQKGVDPGIVLEALGIDRERLATDYDRFGESEIEFAKLMSSPAVREHVEDIRPHLRTPGEEYTPSQKERIRADLPNEIKRQMEEIQKSFEGTAELADREAQAVEMVRERILGADIWGENKVNDANATLAAAMNNTFAKLAGMDPVDFYEAHFPRIQMSVDGMVQEGAPDAEVLKQGGRVRLADIVKDPLESAKRVREADVRKGGTADRPLLTYEFANDAKTNVRFFGGQDGVVRVEFSASGLEQGKATPPQIEESFSDAVAALRHHSRHVRPRRYEFAGEDPAQTRMYERLLKNAKLGDYEARQTESGFEIVRNDVLRQGDDLHRGQFDINNNIITLFESRNYSTLMHEMSHWFLFQTEQFAKEENSPPAIQKMWKDVNAWYDGLERSKAFEPGSRERWVDIQESFAETFETYLETGQAPSVGLRDAFRAFKSWLATLWKTVRGRATELQRANLDPEIVAIFDRMLATEEEVTAATQQTYTEAETVAKGLLDAGILTQKEYDKAIKNLNDAREAVKEEMMKRLMADVNREDEAWWKTERERVKGEKTREFDRSPIGRAWNWLGLGTYKGDVPAEESPGVDVNALYQKQSTKVKLYVRNLDLDEAAQAARESSDSNIKAAQIVSDFAAVGLTAQSLGNGKIETNGVVVDISNISADPFEIVAKALEIKDGGILYQTAARTTLDDLRLEAEQNNAELDHEIKTVRDMLNEAAACAAGVAPVGVGQMVAGTALGISGGAMLAIPLAMNSPSAQAERERRMKEWHLQEHKRLMREDPEYRAKHDQFRAREQERYDNALAEYRAAREFEQKLEAYSDIDNMPTDNQFDMNSWTEQVSGVSGEFLDDLIGHEADGDWQAEAGTSTAKGGGQFIDSTWLRMMRQHGPELGLNPGMSREDILALRTDRRWGTMMTAYYAMENRATLERKLNRPVSQKDAYLAHFLGATAAAKALTMDPDANAAEAFPDAAAANQNVFYKYGNLEKPRTVAEFIQRQTKGFSAEPLMVWDYPVQMNAEPNDGRVDR